SLSALLWALVNGPRLALSPLTLFCVSSLQYGIVFDAGSSHTSLFVYQWPSDKENNTGVVSQTFSCHVDGPGISSYAKNPLQAGESLRKCLDKAMTVIPTERQQEAPAYLGATAGIRLLRYKHRSVAERVLSAVATVIQQYPVSFHGARIITGEEEGAYGWITINYLLDSFTKYSAKQQAWVHPQTSNILGALDLGGASTQISFIPAGPMADATGASEFRLYGFDYTIYTHSYLCYGQNEALLKLIQSIPISHPCYPIGYLETIPATSIYSSPCTAQLQPGLSAASGNVTLAGTGNATQCRKALQKIFNFSACSHNQSCTFNGVYQPPVSGEFMAFSAYYYTFSFLNLTEKQPLDMTQAAIQQFCARNWTEVEQRLRDYCASANYILTLLLDVYNFTETTWGSISFCMQAAGTDIGWTLGYMLNLTNLIPTEAPVLLRAHKSSIWATGIFFIVLTLALCLVALLLLLLH
uniref:Ectonucleoside triphosphate diphosphohydrolase 8 n=1 Tax=Sphenodon punctatus TaxID=8508 RepID=A0A8D0HAR3_SPHPU